MQIHPLIRDTASADGDDWRERGFVTSYVFHPFKQALRSNFQLLRISHTATTVTALLSSAYGREHCANHTTTRTNSATTAHTKPLCQGLQYCRQTRNMPRDRPRTFIIYVILNRQDGQMSATFKIWQETVLG